MEARATLALKPGVWFRRGRLLIVSPDSLGTACPLSGRNSTYRLVQILEAGSPVVNQFGGGKADEVRNSCGRHRVVAGAVLALAGAPARLWGGQRMLSVKKIEKLTAP